MNWCCINSNQVDDQEGADPFQHRTPQKGNLSISTAPATSQAQPERAPKNSVSNPSYKMGANCVSDIQPNSLLPLTFEEKQLRNQRQRNDNQNQRITMRLRERILRDRARELKRIYVNEEGRLNKLKGQIYRRFP